MITGNYCRQNFDRARVAAVCGLLQALCAPLISEASAGPSTAPSTAPSTSLVADAPPTARISTTIPTEPFIRSAKSGAWSNPATWEGKQVPGPGAEVIIRAGDHVTYDVQTQQPFRYVHVIGTLSFARIATPGWMSACWQPSNTNVTGTVSFTQSADGVLVVADFDGLDPNSRHVCHIHDIADVSGADLLTAGKQWKPVPGEQHVSSTIGVLTADEHGHGHFEGTMAGLTISGEGPSILNHTVIIHANGPPKSGPRLAGGVIMLNSAARTASAGWASREIF